MATTIDSGNETLFSDDSPCDLTVSPSIHTVDDPEVAECHNHTNRPPKIQPYSGVLEKGRVVIRPIAFRPGMSPAARFGLDGERYGSTPTLNGCSSDTRSYMLPSSNYSLDRRLRLSCQSTRSSPPLAMSSFTSLPQKLSNYDSLESVRRSPVSTADSTLTNKSSYRLSGAITGSLLDLTPSPSDSGVSELEAALRDRDSELAYLRQTMEHNEQVIFRVYQEKERVWERELKRLKSLHENRLRTSAQKALKLEQLLMMQTYQLQQDKRRLSVEAQKAISENDRLRQEVGVLKERLEETEWNLCQKTGEISLLKSQLKELQADQTTKGHELLQLRNEYRDTREALDTQELETANLSKVLTDKDVEIEKLKLEIQKLKIRLNLHSQPNSPHTHKKLFVEPPNEMLINNTKVIYKTAVQNEEIEYKNLILDSTVPFNNSRSLEINKLKEQIQIKHSKFEEERQKWAQEKEKVLKYQRQLQMNYIHMYRRTKALESEIEGLTIELELDKTGIKKKLSALDINHTIEL